MYADVCVNTAHRLMLGQVTEVVTGVSVQAHGVCEDGFGFHLRTMCVQNCVSLSQDKFSYPGSPRGGQCFQIQHLAHIQSYKQTEKETNLMLIWC